MADNIVHNVYIDGLRANSERDSVTYADTTDVLYTSTDTSQQVIHSFDTAAYRGAKWVIEMSAGVDREMLEIIVTHDDTTPVWTAYGQIFTNAELATFTVEINTDKVELKATPVTSVTEFRIFQIGFTV